MAIKLALAASIPLFADETYYWVWGQKPDWSYFDHPPMIGWWFSLSEIFALPTALARWPGVILAHLGFWIWIRILREEFPRTNPKPFLWLYLLCPLTGLGGIAMTPDLPLTLFWAASVWLSLRYLKDGRWQTAGLLGMALGLGFLSKYMIVLLPLSLLPLLATKAFRQRILSAPILVTLLMGAFFCLPVLYWNWTHEWASFSFQLNHGLERKVGFDPRTILDYVLGVALVLAPLAFALKGSLSVGPRRLLLICSGLGPFIFFLLTSFRAHVELNWPMMGLPALMILASSVSALNPSRIYYGAISLALGILLLIPLPAIPVEKLLENRKYAGLLPELQSYRPLYASSYQMASSLWYLTSEPTYKLRGSRRFDMFDMWSESLPSADRFFLLRDPDDRWPESMDSWSAEKIDHKGSFELWEMRKK